MKEVRTSPEKEDACRVLGKAKNLSVIVPQLVSAAGLPVEFFVGLSCDSLGRRRPPHACRAHVSSVPRSMHQAGFPKNFCLIVSAKPKS